MGRGKRPWLSGPPHLVGGHLPHRAPRLQGLQLIQTPVQLIQCLQSQLLPSVLWGLSQSGACPAPTLGP